MSSYGGDGVWFQRRASRHRSSPIGPRLIQLLAAGAILYALAQSLHDARVEERDQPRRVELTAADLDDLKFSWLGEGRAAPTFAEMRHLVDARLREEILYREALALGLDRGDPVVRQRLAQKMEFLLGDVAELREPGEDELRTWFRRNRARFAEPARVTFHHVYFSSDRRGARAREDAAVARAILAESPWRSPVEPSLGDPSLVAPTCAACSADEIAAQLGPSFAVALTKLEPRTWSEPIESSYGWHLVWIDASTAERVPAFEDVEGEVKRAFAAEREVEIARQAYEAIRRQYEVVLPAVPAADETSRREERP